MAQPNQSILQVHKIDILIAIVLGLLFCVGTYLGARMIPEIILIDGNNSIWFEADTDRAYGVATDRQFRHHMTDAHPLFPIIAHPTVSILKKVLHLEPLTAVRLMIACVAFLWMGGLYLLFRLIGCLRLDSVLFAVLGGVSASSMFWFTVPETFTFGTLSILTALLFVVLSQTFRFSPFGYCLISVMTLSFVITNWMVAIVATLVSHPFKRAVTILVYAFFTVTVLWGLQAYIYKDCKFFLGNSGMARYVFNKDAGGPDQKIRSMFFHTIVMPEIKVSDRYQEKRPEWPIMYTQQSMPGSGSPWGTMAVILWSVLMTLGFWGLFKIKGHERFRITLGLSLLGQFCLHFIYGDETFLYSLHFLILLIPLAAMSVLTPLRVVARIIVILLLPLLIVNNTTQFKKALEFFSQRGVVAGHGVDKYMYQ